MVKSRMIAAGAAAALLALALAAPRVLPAAAADAAPLWFDDAASSVRVAGQQFVDGHGRTVVLRGFNVSGTAKLAEHGGLPFASVADADRSAAAMRRLTGANTVRFLITWAYAEPAPGRLDTVYLQKVTDQVRVFINRGFQVLLDYHQDLYSRYLFNAGSWYTGDGAPRWVIEAGNYPRESCGICLQWGQNITQNEAVKQASHDFWHNRVLQTAAGPVGVQDAFLNQAQRTLTYLRQHLTDAEFRQVVGFDPLNEPYAGKYDSGQTSQDWERDMLWPFYQKFRARMDAAGWATKPAFVEPNVFWDSNLSFAVNPGGLANIGKPGPRYVFNAHYYDHAAMSGIFLLGKATDGRYAETFRTIRERGAALGTAAVVSEFGGPITGTASDKTPTMLKGMYQALDSAVPGAKWWSQAASSPTVLSGIQWQWDINNGAHREAMNGNPDKVLTEGDAWNGEDFSVVRRDADGAVVTRVDPRVIDRVFPRATAGAPLAFTFEDRSRDGSTTLTWNPVPSTMPNLRTLVGDGQYAVLVWRSGGGAAPTELHLPASFPPAGTTVLSDLGTVRGLPAYAPGTTIAAAPLPGDQGGQRLILSAAATAGRVHYALITNGPAASAAVSQAAQSELAAWVAARFG